MKDAMNYMGYEWVTSDDGMITIGINEEGLEEFTEILSIDLPSEDEEVSPDEVCGEIETEQGPLNLYSPLAGVVVEINEAVIERPELIQEDPLGDGWLFKVEPASMEELDSLGQATTNDED